MRKLIVQCLVVAVCFVGCGSTSNADTPQCDGAIAHIRKITQQGDLPIAKLLIDHAVADIESGAMPCDAVQRATVMQLREDIYLVYIAERIRIAKEDIIVRHDGFAALRGISIATSAAQAIDIEFIADLDSLRALAYVGAAYQNIRAAKEAEQQDDCELRDLLLIQAADFLRFASELDPRVKKRILEEMAKP